MPRKNAMVDRLAQREYSLHAMMDLSQALTQSHDLYSTIDALLLNLMGQFRLSRACVWLLAENGSEPLILARTRGVDASHARILMGACATRLLSQIREGSDPITIERLIQDEEAPTREFATRTGLQVFAPIRVREELFGILGLGPRLDGETCSELDVRLLQTSLSIASIALESGRFYGRLLEKSRDLQITSERLEELNRLKLEFLGNINHELRTPLSIIIASIDCLGRMEKEGSPGQEFLHYAGGQAQKLLGMVENLLALSATAQDPDGARAAVADIVPLVSAYCEERQPGVSSGLHELSCVLETGQLEARFDESHLRTILDALVENAVKFTPAGSKIRIRLREAAEGGRRWARIDVEDDGPGITAAHRLTIFEPFRQVDGSMTRKAGGMGIGLALARRLAEGMGGRLTVTSEEGSGSCFSLDLPAGVQFTEIPADDRERRGAAMSDELTISELDKAGRTVVFRLNGRLDVKTSPLLLQKATDVQSNGQNLVLNLSGVSFIGSSGIGALLVLVEQFQEQAGVIRLVSPSPEVEAVIHLLNLDRFLAVDPSEEKALAEIGG